MLADCADRMCQHHLQCIFYCLHYFFASHNADVYIGNARYQTGIAFVGLDQNCARFGNAHVRACHADIGIEKNRSQVFAHDSHNRIHIAGHILTRCFFKYFGYFNGGFMYSGKYEMEWFFVDFLNNKLAEIGLNYLQSRVFHWVVDFDFFAC